MYIQLKNFIQKYKWRIVPVILAAAAFFVGWVLRWHSLDIGFCTSGDVNCSEFAVWIIGDPTLSLSKWLFAAAFLLLFTPDVIIRRWAFFAVPYLLLSFVLIALSPVSSFWGKDAIADLLGMIFVGLSLCWVAAHALILHCQEKRKRG